jgi:ubiquinone/menaquinone biosynthesis C-methylase UbiE
VIVRHAPIGSFDELADDYDRYRIGYAAELYDAIFDYGLERGARVVDVASGTGLVAAELVSRGCFVVGADVSEAMCRKARERVPGASFVLGRAEELPFEDASFDAGTCAQSFHWFDQKRALEEMLRVVRPGGIVAIWWKGFMRGDAIRHLRDEAASEIGLPPTDDLLTKEFAAFDRAPLEDQVLRIVPWITQVTVAGFLGYERSRARARHAYGEKLEAYFEALAARLGDPHAELALSYLQLLYLGRVPRRGD